MGVKYSLSNWEVWGHLTKSLCCNCKARTKVIAWNTDFFIFLGQVYLIFYLNNTVHCKKINKSDIFHYQYSVNNISIKVNSPQNTFLCWFCLWVGKKPKHFVYSKLNIIYDFCIAIQNDLICKSWFFLQLEWQKTFFHSFHITRECCFHFHPQYQKWEVRRG